MNQPLLIAQDRGLKIPAGAIVRTAYVPIHKIKLACRDRMSVGDVDRAYQKRLQLGKDQSWPCPNGYWDEIDEGYFVVKDGRHEFVSAIMLGHSHLLVAWVEEAHARQRDSG